MRGGETSAATEQRQPPVPPADGASGWMRRTSLDGLRQLHRFLDSRFLQTLVLMAMTLVGMMLLVEVHQLRRSGQQVQQLRSELHQLNQTMVQLNNLTFLQTDLLYDGRLSAARGEPQGSVDEALEASTSRTGDQAAVEGNQAAVEGDQASAGEER